MLSFYEARGWVAQKKKNGTCTVVFANGDDVIFKTRHNDDHKMWTPKQDHVKFFQGRPGWNVYVCELLHSKVKGGPKDELYIFDQIVCDSFQLIGSTFEQRQKMLDHRFPGKDTGDVYRLADRVSRAKLIYDYFDEVFEELEPEDEGLVLKDPNGVLERCTKDGMNTGWQVKCRLPTKNYSA
jgi:hypothetical protein